MSPITRRAKIEIVLVIVLFGSVISFAGITYAQTSTDEFSGVSTGLIMSVIALISTGFTLIKTLADKGILDKRVGSVAVMAGDAAVAIRDSREMIQEGLQAGFDIIGTTSPEAARQIQQNAVPVMKRVTQRVDEYTPKVQSFVNIAAKLSQKKTSEIEDIKEQIPNEIVPS